MFGELDLLTFLCLCGMFQGLLLAAAVATTGGPLAKANRVLAVILLGAVLVLAVIVWSHRPAADALSTTGRGWVELVEWSLWLVAGPIALLYVTVVTRGDRWPSARFALHFLPCVGFLGYWTLSRTTGATPHLVPVELMMLHQAAYTVLALRRWLAFRTSTAEVGEAEQPANLGLHDFWVPALLATVVAQHAAQMVRWLLRHEQVLRDVVPYTGAVSFVVLALFGLRRAAGAMRATGAETPKQRYASSSLGADRAEQLAHRIRELMEAERPYLRPELTIDDVAEAVGTSRTHLSQVLNDNLEQSFPEFLATYRARECARLLDDESLQDLKVAAVGARGGFRSRSAFYDAFRRLYGTTPAEFRRSRAGARAAGD